MENLIENTMQPETEKEFSETFEISNADRINGFRKLEALIKEMRFDEKAPKIVIAGCSEDDAGTDKSVAVNIERYQSFWKALVDFCFLIGDIGSSMLPCRALCPADPLPVKLEMALLFLQFCYLKSGMILKHPTTNQPVKDIHGHILHTRGDWKGVSVPGLYRSALSKLHIYYETTSGVPARMHPVLKNPTRKYLSRPQLFAPFK
jgi:hypothetical protein